MEEPRGAEQSKRTSRGNGADGDSCVAIAESVRLPCDEVPRGNLEVPGLFTVLVRRGLRVSMQLRGRRQAGVYGAGEQ